jgi:hypothetical protein
VSPREAILVALLLALASPRAASGQSYGTERYEMQYGVPVDVSVDDLIQMPESYLERAVHTRGNLEFLGRESWALRGGFGGRILIIPVREVAAYFEDEARRWMGREVEITGVVQSMQDPDLGAGTTVVRFWEFVGPPEEKKEAPRASPELRLEELVTKPGRFDGKTVRVVGKFRGDNLYGDLPSRSRRRSSDWVIKDDIFAVWVTGKKPKGSGFSLDPKMRRDTGRWLVVVGRVSTVKGVVYLQATDVELGAPPTATAEAKPPPPPPPVPKQPPVIVFSLPLDGEREIPQDSLIRVQFSKDMQEASFRGRVLLRYAGRRRPGDREFDAVRLMYDIGRKALTVDPGDVLRAGRTLELLLLPGITDLDGLPLETRPGIDPGGAVDRLRFEVAAGLVTGTPF